MKITKNQIKFTAKTITLKTDAERIYQIDYVISMLSGLIVSSLEGINREDLWTDYPDFLHVDIELEDGTETQISIYNSDNHLIKVFVGNDLVEEVDELLFATQFLENIRNDINEIYSVYKQNKDIFANMKADIRDELNNLELAIDLYER